MKKNQSVDLLHGPIFKSLSLLAIPIMATYFIQMAYNLVDMLWIGFLGSGAVASVGVSGNFMYLANGLVNMPKIGSQALVGQSLGANNKKETKNYIEAAFQSSILFALIYGIIIIVFQKNLIQLFNLKDSTIIQDAQNYLWITCGFIIFSFVNQIFTGILTAAGHSKNTFIATTTGLVLNLILDPVLIFVCNLRVIGAALATIIAQIIVTLVFLYDVKKLDLSITLPTKSKITVTKDGETINDDTKVYTGTFTQSLELSENCTFEISIETYSDNSITIDGKEISFDKTDWQEGQPAIITLQVGKGNQKETEEYSQYDDSGYDYGYSDEYYGQEGDYTYDQNEYTEQTNDY